MIGSSLWRNLSKAKFSFDGVFVKEESSKDKLVKENIILACP